MKISSNRLHLIEFDENLLNEKIMSWFSNTDLMKYYTNSKKAITKDILIDSIKKGKAQKNNFTYFIVHSDSNSIIGTIKIGPINSAHKTSDLVALIGERGDFGKGIGTEAIELGVKLAFEILDIRKLFGGMYASNIPSIKAYTRAGWIVEGVLKGHYINEGKNEDRILVGCFNPKYFSETYIEEAKYRKWYKQN
ncbi:Acetyltransferase (GNAT) domain protein [Tenacibaculum maritimum]|uniref:GNAT family N-acetyltransferase n=1 Tax=Tenacibaculum maritimum TaxID=107401 RepID=UPI0012E6DD4A|nr:GNAT family protein [Tenacibaculum maritimum]CAA0149123.1 Acetyltransferase (GNAT) domain protein [Tenacibaculum maritimum]CAA0184002.1 Acetyltransferase (GNAT) domain protein [Tenacibaculum maritimum]CAA0243095.1 Acetyltransferase (GNAT) domain protein [Tenacibaculum maritimum]